ncbi:MAG: hypothetical protein QG556_954 [Pseudomonadota bacterium]|nr:hypothetical protein [Pseudomonadota bacterium]
MQYVLTLLTMMILDGIWLGAIAKSHYYQAYGHILRLENNQLQPLWWSALLVYVFLVFGIHFYGLSYSKISWVSAIGHAALFGLVVYGVYDFTCLAIFKDWPIVMTIVDWLWGGCLCALTSLMVLLIRKI